MMYFKFKNNNINQVKEKIRNLRRDRFMSYSFNKILQLL